MPSPTFPSAEADLSDPGAPLPEFYLKQSVLDATFRMRNGLVLYPSIWMVLMQVDGYAGRHALFAWGHAAALCVICLARFLYGLYVPRFIDQNFKRTRFLFRAQSLLHNLYWGCLCAYVMRSTDAETLRWLMLMSTVGITSGGTVIVALDSVLPRLYPLCTLGPTVVALIPLGGSTNYAISGLTALMFGYSLNMSRMVSREYWGRQRSQALLELRAKELEALSRTDALTQVPNRLRFQEGLAQAWRDARRRDEPLAIAMVDLDHFKRINDTHGHPFGDRCLHAAAQALVASVRRPYDLVARYGGEEFVVLMPNTDIEGARLVAQELLDQIQRTVVSSDQASVQLSCSIGISAGDSRGLVAPEQLVKEADSALYTAKQSGRGCVRGHHEHSVTPMAAVSGQDATA
jgi:diguanylate cyclase (GGDEF)-like protein